MRTSNQADRDVPIVQFLQQVLMEGLQAEKRIKEMHSRGEDVSHVTRSMQQDGFRTRTLFV